MLNPDIEIQLDLGDFIQIVDPANENLNNQVFFIDYIDDTQMFLINSVTFQMVKININPDGSLNDGTISQIAILNKSDEKGYARQHNLIPNTWIDIHFGGDHPTIITGRITNLENDMIEIKTTHDDTIYINFDYKGIPLDLPIKLIEIREEPIEQEKQEKQEEQEQEEQEQVKEQVVPVKNVRDQLREFIINADQIVFGERDLGTIYQYETVSTTQQRYSIESQVTDMLDEFLSKIPDIQRTQKVLNNIHTIIERFKQLREHFSTFDEYGNVEGAFTLKPTHKPLFEYFEKFQKNLYWILPVVKNVKKIYDGDNVIPYSDVVHEEIEDDVRQINALVENYKSNDLPNKYRNLFADLNPYFTPFESISDEKSVTAEREVNCDINVIIDNLDNMYSSIFSNNNIKTRRFVVQKYNLGLTKLDTVDVKGNTRRVVLTRNDTMSLQSIITLPEPTIRFSRVNLPGTNILDKANLNQTFLNFWQFLNKKTNVKVVEVDDLNGEIKFNEDNFVNNIKNYVLTATSDNMDRSQVYARFIEMIVPKTKIIFNLMKKYIVGKLSVVDVVSYLEPFLIYTDSLTYMQYSTIVEFIDKEISSYNKKINERSRAFGLLRNIQGKLSFSGAYSIVTILKQNEAQVFDAYNIDTYENKLTVTNDEILRKLTIKDSLRLYSSALSLQAVALTVADEFSGIFKTEPKEKVDKCDPVVFAKSYSNLKALEEDNEKSILFDKKYDSTNYSLIDNYESKMFELSPEDFVAYLSNDLMKKLKLGKTEVDYLVETLINGYKKVRDGQYALLFKEYNETYSEQYDHYIRKNNRWTKTVPPIEGVFTDDTDILCNLRESCVSTSSNKCETTDTNDLTIRNKLLNEIVNEFDEKYKISKQELQAKLQSRFEYFLSIMDKLSIISRNVMLKYNNIKYLLSVDNEEPSVISPYFKIRDLVLSQQDFVKKQNDIIKFKTLYTREAIAGQDETEHWLYCTATNVKLLPTFKYDLARAFVTNRDEYNTYVELLKARIGKQSDDGDSWVDKYSGWPIARIDFDTQEGYDEGFKITSRAILEEDAGDRILVKTGAIQYDNPESRMISNVVNSLSHNMGINIESQKDFIINSVMTSLNNVGDAADYSVRVKEAANKNRILPSYADYRNSYLLFCTLGLFLISIQTSIPSVRTKRTLPGCVKSFGGYPFEGGGDMSSVNYLTCVVDQVRKGRTEPWNVLARIKKEVIADRIKKFIDDVLMSNPEVKRKINEKVEYLLVNAEPEIPETHNILHWTNFLPPLAPFQIKNPANVTDDFEKQLMKNMQQGSPDQFDKLLIIESKIILFSLALQEKIQDVVKNKDFILSKANNEPYLENACCDSKSGQTTIQYFEKENAKIKEYNDIVGHLSAILADVTNLSKSGLLHSKINTKNTYPAVGQTFDERTIYMAFIQFCKFQSLNPVPGDLLPICKDKPTQGIFKKSETLSEMIQKLKSDGREYSNETFLRLLQIVSRNNIVDVKTNSLCISSITKLLGVLDSVKKNNHVNREFTDKIYDALQTFSIATDEMSPETEKLNNFLIKRTDEMKKELTDFIVKNKTGDMDRKSIEKVANFSKNLLSWSTDKYTDNKISSDSTYNAINFIKTFIDNFVNVFPSIVLNKINYNTVAIPSYWKLSQFHNNDIKNLIRGYYEKLKIFYDVQSLYNVLNEINDVSKDIIALANSTPCFTSIKYKDKEFVPVFDEQTSTNLFEYYFHCIIANYIVLTDRDDMIVTEIPKPSVVDDVFSVEAVEETVTRVDINVDPRLVVDARIFSGNKKQLKQQVSHLLVVFLNMMDNHKSTIDISYEDIQDRVFKLKEREKNLITDRLKALTPEERDADTILKINKLGVWNKGLQKGLTSYVADTYDDERELRENFEKLENKLMKGNTDPNNRDLLIADLMEQQDVDDEIERDAYDMRGSTDDYDDGNFEGDEVDNYGDYD